MCLAIPMKIVEINGHQARCQAAGVERDVDIFLLQNEPLKPGDFVMVHVGYAIQKVVSEEARSAWALHHEMINMEGDQHA